MILPTWAFYTIICLLAVLVSVYLHRLGERDNEFKVEDFLMSKDPSGNSKANPHKLAFLLTFVICAWINVMIAPMIATSAYALYYSFAFMGVFTVSLLSKSALTIIRDIIQIWVTKQAPAASNPGGDKNAE